MSLNKEKQQIYYNKKDEPIAHWTEEIPMPHFYPNIYVFKKFLANVKDKDILDFGCGAGQFSYFLARRGAKVTAIDISEKNIHELRKLALSHEISISTMVGSVDDCSLRDESFDIIFGSAILHHLELDEEKKALQEAYRLLKQDGIAIFIEPLENLQWFRNLINYIPVMDKYNPRPSKLSCEYAQYVTNDPHPIRPLTTDHFLNVFKLVGFKPKVKEIGIFNRADRLTRNRKIRAVICALDYYFLQYIVPFRSKFCRNIVIIAKK
jgi:ubiquinone/menaquinone biosynthesis C-methylase UbiE